MNNTATDFNTTIMENNKFNIKIGLLLPFHIDDNQTQSVILGGISGVRMAAAEINALELIPGAEVTLIEKDSYPTINGQTSTMTQAILSTVSLIQDGVVGVIGDISSSWTALSALMTSTLQIPQCSFSANASSLADKSEYAYFFRTVPTDLLYVDAVLKFIVDQKWPIFGILYTDTDLGRQLTQTFISKSKKLGGIQVKSYQTFFDSGDTNNIHASIDTLMSLGSRVVFIASKDTEQITAVLTIAAQAGHINHETVWITMTDIKDQLPARVESYNSIISSRLLESSFSPPRFKNAVESVAWTTKDLEFIDYKTAFVGGIFTFEPRTDLMGYAPFDEFNQKWTNATTSIEHVNYHTGLAYSCMMVMAHGLGRIVKDSFDHNDTLQKLAMGQLSDDYSISVFNDTGFVGPQGPVLFDKNGDTSTGNFKIYNIQNGSQFEIGKILGGTYSLSSRPVYFDGTNNPPSGTPSLTVITSGYSTPISLVTACMSLIGIVIAILVLIIVVIYRKHHVFKSSSPIFCILELSGFILSYISILLFFNYSASLFNCFMLPISFYVSLSIILGTMILRNYRVYRTVNNVYAANQSSITNTIKSMIHPSSNFQLLKLFACVLAANSFILTFWLIFAQVQLVKTSVSSTVSLTSCSYDGPGHTIFIVLLSSIAGTQLCFSTFLAVKTKSFGGYSKHGEHKQLGLSVYNIFFSALIGFIIFFMPTTDYYTRHYLTAMTILWATTFSMSVLFFPKVYKLFYEQVFKKKEDDDDTLWVSSSLPDKLDHVVLDEDQGSRTTLRQHEKDEGSFLLDKYQETLPIQYVFRYFPYLARWQMQNIVFYPQVSYFSFYDAITNKSKNKKGTGPKIFSYSHASVESSIPGSYVFRVHGSAGFFDLLIQVANEIELSQWCERFKRRNFICHDSLYDGSSKYNTIRERLTLEKIINSKVNIDTALSLPIICQDDNLKVVMVAQEDE